MLTGTFWVADVADGPFALIVKRPNYYVTTGNILRFILKMLLLN